MGFLFHVNDPDRDAWDAGSVVWHTKSLKDPRFDFSGRCSSLFVVEREATKAIEAKAQELGCEPPDDIEVGGTKER